MALSLSLGVHGPEGKTDVNQILDKASPPLRPVLRPRLDDVRMAQNLATRIASVGHGKVRRVVMIGSRALGTAAHTSDLDLVVIVELAPHESPWNGVEADAERDRLQRELGPPPIPTDMTVRSAEQFEEARDVVGGVERLVELEGVDVYVKPFDRPPKARRTKDAVRLALGRAWLDASVGSIEEGFEVRNQQNSCPLPVQPNAIVDRGQPRLAAVAFAEANGIFQITLAKASDKKTESDYWARAVRQAITALCVLYQFETSKHDDLLAIVKTLGRWTPDISKRLPPRIQSEPRSLETAIFVLGSIVGALPQQARNSAHAADISRKIHSWHKRK